MSLKNDPVESMEQERLCASEDMQRRSSRQHCPGCQEARRRRWSLPTNCTQGQTLSRNEVVPIHIITFLLQVMPRPELLPKASVYEDLFWLLQLFFDVPPSTQMLHKAISVQWPLYLPRKLPAKFMFTSEFSSKKNLLQDRVVLKSV